MANQVPRRVREAKAPRATVSLIFRVKSFLEPESLYGFSYHFPPLEIMPVASRGSACTGFQATAAPHRPQEGFSPAPVCPRARARHPNRRFVFTGRTRRPTATHRGRTRASERRGRCVNTGALPSARTRSGPDTDRPAPSRAEEDAAPVQTATVRRAGLAVSEERPWLPLTSPEPAERPRTKPQGIPGPRLRPHLCARPRGAGLRDTPGRSPLPEHSPVRLGVPALPRPRPRRARFSLLDERSRPSAGQGRESGRVSLHTQLEGRSWTTGRRRPLADSGYTADGGSVSTSPLPGFKPKLQDRAHLALCPSWLRSS